MQSELRGDLWDEKDKGRNVKSTRGDIVITMCNIHGVKIKVQHPMIILDGNKTPHAARKCGGDMCTAECRITMLDR